MVNLEPRSGSTEHFAEGDAINRFNGALIQTLSFSHVVPISERFSYQLDMGYTSSIWDLSPGHPDGVRAEPQRRFNAGLGWQLSFGELLAPGTVDNPDNLWLYRAPDGQVSRFYTALADGDAWVPNVFYTRDSTYLRLNLDNAGAHVAFPDGRTKRFIQTTTGAWRFDAEHDVFNNHFHVDYSVANEWRVHDSHGRLHKLIFTTDPTGSSDALLSRVEVAAFGGATAVWHLGYTTATIPRPPQDSSSLTPATVVVSLLSSIQSPEDNSQTFGYAVPGSPGVADAGRLTSVRLSTGGTITYDYGTIALPYLNGALHSADVVGVAKRRTWDFGGATGAKSTPAGTWTFNWSMDQPRVAGSMDQPRELTAEITYPDNHRRTHAFSVYVSGQAANDQQPSTDFLAGDYGLPFTQNGRISTNPLRPSIQIYDTDGITLLRSQHVRITRVPCAGCWDGQPRIDHTRTIYEDTPSRAMDTKAFTHFDSLGQSARTYSVESGGFAPPRTILTDRSLPRPGPTAPWILGLSQRREVSEGSSRRITESCVEPTTGLTLRERTLAGDTRAANDLVRTYSYDAQGNLTTIHFYGGDVQPLSTADLCTLTLPATEQYATYQEHQFGALRETGWLDAAGQPFVVSYLATIDPNTGLPITTDRGDGFVWTYAYDLRGRQLSATPPAGHGGIQAHVYTAANLTATQVVPAVNASTVLEADGTVLSATRTHLDAFGRVSRVERDTDDGWQAVTQTYDGMGRLTSTVGPDGATTSTIGFDGLGRALRIRPPAGAAYDRVLVHEGRTRSETVTIGKSWDAASSQVIEVARTTIDAHDRHGRRWRQTIMDADGEWRRKTLQLNLNGAVIAVHVTNGAETSQWTKVDRTDNRGFLTSEPDGTPISGYDALGNQTTSTNAVATLHRIRDRAARLVETREGSPTGLLWERNTYATDNTAGTFQKGKLIESLRVNRGVPHLPNGHVEVTDVYAYEGDGGRASALTTEVVAGLNGGMSIARFTTNQTHDGTGALERVAYPDCDPSANSTTSTCVPTLGRVVHYDRSLGRLTSVHETWGGVAAGWIDQIVYHPSGLATSRALANGFVEQATPHVSGGGRIDRMTINHPVHGVFYDSGFATYDGRGRMVQLGQQRRISDAAYALTIPKPPSDAGTTQTLPPRPNQDALGSQTWRSYRVPYRNDPANGHEYVWEIVVYGPGNRPVWTRVFNDYDAFAHGYSKDRWRLVGLDGNHLRTRPSLTYYQGPMTFQQATVDRVDLSLAYTKRVVDRILLGQQRIGQSDHNIYPGRKSFYHRDIRRHLLAVSDQDGNILENTTPLQ